MKYEKPSIALVASAIEAVKGSPKDTQDAIDNTFSTVSAYESDE